MPARSSVPKTITDKHIERIDHQLQSLDHRLDRIETRINYLFGGLAVIITLANLLLPVIEKHI